MNSPPVGAGAAAPPARVGIWMTLKPFVSASPWNHEPFSAKPKSPVFISSQLVPCVLVSTDCGAAPDLTQSVHSVSAATDCEESSAVRSASAPQNQGRNWNVPSSVPTAE